LRRVDIRAILRDPVQRRGLLARVLVFCGMLVFACNYDAQHKCGLWSTPPMGKCER